jgi:hypothetical protein
MVFIGGAVMVLMLAPAKRFECGMKPRSLHPRAVRHASLPYGPAA